MMNTFLDQMAEILEEDSVQLADKLTDFDTWDSLTQLSIIAMADETYGVTISAEQLKEASTVGGVQAILAGQK